MHKTLFLLFLIIPFTFSFSQENIKFRQALEKYESQQYEQALSLFREISSTFSAANKDAALLFTGKSELKLNKLQDARRTLTEFIKRYPGSGYKDEARITLSKIHYEIGDSPSAFKEMLYLIDEAGTEEYIRLAKKTGSAIALNELVPGELETILSSISGKRSRPFALLLTGKLYMRQNNKLEADAAFLEIMESYPDSDEMKEAETLYKQKKIERTVIISDEDAVPVIAVLLPLTKKESREQLVSTAEILEGIKYALSEYNNAADEKVGLLVKDTYNSPAEIEEISKELLRIPTLKVIIGPAFSDEVRAALRVFKDKSIPIVSPTATDDDLAEMNDYFFQANPSFAVRGKAMAQYIFYVERKRKIGVINAVEGYSPSIALSFTSEFERLGGQIIVRETYRSGSFELQDQIRRVASHSGSLDGLFIPLSDKSDASAIVNELMMNNIDVPVYGNQDWFYSKISGNSILSEKLTFTSDHFIDYNSNEFQEFSKNFNLRTGIEADRNVLYGYDAAKFILTTVSDWNQNPAGIKRSFESGIMVEGYHNNISFGRQRVNNYLNIIRYREGVFELIEKFKAASK